MKYLFLLFLSLKLFAQEHIVHILDAKTLDPISKSYISDQINSFPSNEKGVVKINTHQKTLYVRAYGYKQKSIPVESKTVFLEPFTAKALYVSFWAAGSSKYMRRILKIVRSTEINTVIIDVKNEFGNLSYKTKVNLAKKIGAHKQRSIYNIEDFIKQLKSEGLYVIARIVVFKDERLARNHENYALKDSNGTIWRNREKLAWVNPFELKVHEYVASIAADAASKGFDEINFDYVRFPLKKGLIYTKKMNQRNRIKAISDFLDTANKKLLPYNVYTSVDTYGYVCWNKSDTNIGHTIKSLSTHTDYISPMLYPSGFGAGMLGYKNPTDHNYEIINKSIKEGLKRADINALRFRPWLQSFKDYGFDRKFYRSKEVSEQIKGAEQALCSGWMLWNPSSRFSSKGLQDLKRPYPILPAFKEAKNLSYCFRKEEN
ncbi:putative glycoside hydrolase [Sulfurimonas sp. MAG313]|nr:putative glycoside hydrolase [Sulfurimonas sp. MAG313]MDF1880454.1 putative glycoside hydrolase [Sulfurimonas sp. MAG313]